VGATTPPRNTSLPIRLNRFAGTCVTEVPAKFRWLFYDAGDPIAPSFAREHTNCGARCRKSQTATFELKMDPRFQTSAADLRKHFRTHAQLRDPPGRN